MIRLDGRAFHTFTAGLPRPFDSRLSKLMIDTTAHLVQETGAKLGYTQSDEITLCWTLDLHAQPAAEFLFGGRFQKLSTVVASMATAYFNRELPSRIPEKAGALPAFDGRAWSAASADDAFLAFLWRQDDGIRNSVSTAAQARLPPAALHGRGRAALRAMLRDAGAPWEDLPLLFRSGTFLARVERLVALGADALARIPERHRPAGPVRRGAVEDLGLGPLLAAGPDRAAVRALLGCAAEPAAEPAAGVGAGGEDGEDGDSDDGAAAQDRGA
jgi:tRNA(His) guanylyltransferase